MAGISDSLRLSDSFTRATATNGAATATVAAKATCRFVVTSISISASAAPAATVEVTLKDGAGTFMDAFQIPAAAFAPVVINYNNHSLMGPVNTTVVLDCPALGSGVIGVVVLKGFYSHA